MGYLMLEPLPVEEQLWYCLTQSWEDKGVHAFSKGFSSKVNLIAQLTHFEGAVNCFNHYTMEIS